MTNSKKVSICTLCLGKKYLEFDGKHYRPTDIEAIDCYRCKGTGRNFDDDYDGIGRGGGHKSKVIRPT